VYVMPSNRCPGSGIGELGTNPSRAWVFTCDLHRAYAHELGHNLGMHHAATPDNEYGDDSDPMGSMGKLKTVNAPHKVQMEWLPESQIRTVALDGSYEIAPLASAPASVAVPQVLKVSRPGTSEFVYLSYRAPTSLFESNLPGNYLGRVNVHSWAGGNEKTYLLAALTDGETFVDPSDGFTVTQLSHGDTHASVRLHLGSGCSRSPAVMSLSPRDQGGPAGTAVEYDVAIASTDTAGCTPAQLVLAYSVPTGWQAALSNTTLQLAPGTQASAQLSVTAPLAAAAGLYNVSVTASGGSESAASAIASGTYTLSNQDTTPPKAPGGLVAKVKGRDVLLTWSASTDNVAVAFYRVSRNGAVIGTAPTGSWVDASVPAGTTYTYSVVAVDAAGNASASSNSATVQLSAGGGKRK
jgi:hypothetical protein